MTAAAVRTDRLSKRYGEAHALIDLDLEVHEGEILGYLGPNGAGKTTTIRILLGLARATSGRASIFGLDVQRGAVEIHRRVAFVPGEASLWPSLTGSDVLVCWADSMGRSMPATATGSSPTSTWTPRRRSAPTPKAPGRS